MIGEINGDETVNIFQEKLAVCITIQEQVQVH